jgi:hypothetical protein
MVNLRAQLLPLAQLFSVEFRYRFRPYPAAEALMHFCASAGLWILVCGCSTSGSGLDGCLYWMDQTAASWSDDEWSQQIDYMKRAGFRHVMLWGPAQAILTDPPGPAVAAAHRFFAAGRDRGIAVYLSLWSHPHWFGRWDLDEELQTNARVIDRFGEEYGQYPHWAGWYIPHEIYVMWGDKRQFMIDLYAGLAGRCKQATPGKVVMLSPFFILDREGYLGDFRYAEPAEYEVFWYDVLSQTKIDIVALQDSGEHLSCYTMADRRPFFAAMKRACDRARKSFWLNVETGELHVDCYEDYATRFGRKTHVNDPKTQPFWRAVPPERLRAKLDLAHEFTDTTVTWGYREYWDPMRGNTAREVYYQYAK